MRILHTADWHLGRSMGERRLLDDQATFCDWLVEAVTGLGVELVVIAGDLYDRPVPPADAVVLLGETLRRLVARGCKVLAIAGNHDGPERLSAFDGLTDAAGVIIRGGSIGSSVVLEGRSDEVAFVAVPYLDPLLAPRSTIGDDQRPTHDHLVRAALAEARLTLPAGVASVAVAHGFVSGGEPSESERGLAVGTAGRVGGDCFAGFDYAALGHLHKPQVVGGSDRVRYSGSPLAYSFSETATKQVVVAEVAGPGRVSVEPIDIPVGRRVATIRGPLAELLNDPALEAVVDRWVRAEVSDTAFDARRRLLARFPHLVEIARTCTAPGQARASSPAIVSHRVDPVDVATEFWAEVTGSAPDPAVRSTLAAAILTADRVVDAGAEPAQGAAA